MAQMLEAGKGVLNKTLFQPPPTPSSLPPSKVLQRNCLRPGCPPCRRRREELGPLPSSLLISCSEGLFVIPPPTGPGPQAQAAPTWLRGRLS